MIPSPAHLTLFTEAVCPPRAYSILLCLGFHTRTELSFDAEARRGILLDEVRCIGSQASEVIHFVCPFRGSPIALPDLGSHIRTLLSIDPVATVDSYPSHSTQRIQPVWPVKVDLGNSVDRSHILAVLSPEPVASKLPVGEKDAQRIGCPCPTFTKAKERVQHMPKGCQGECRWLLAAGLPLNVLLHLVTNLTLKTASGSQTTLIVSSVDRL